MAHFIVAALTASVVGGMYIKFWKYKYWSRLGLQSKEGSLPFGFGNRFVFQSSVVTKEFKDLYNDFKTNSGRHGGIYIFTSPVYVPIDPVIVKRILQNEAFSQRNLYHNSKKDCLFNKLYYASKEEAKTYRQNLNNLFANKENQELYLKSIENISLELNGDVKITEYLSLVNAQIVKQLFLNECVNNTPDEILLQNLNKLAHSQDYFATKSILSLISSNILKIFFARISNKQAINFFASEVEKVVNFRNENNSKEDFLNALLKIDDNANIISNIIMLILGNCKFVSSTVSFCLFELAKNQEIQDKLRKELMTTQGELTLSTIDSLEYLDQVIKETLRKYPVMPIIKRSNTSSFTVPQSSIVIAENMDVIIPVAGLHYDSDYFEDPETFKPDRFNKENSQKIQEFTYIPYGSGQRDCIGKTFSDIQLKVLLLKFVRAFKMTLTDSEAAVAYLPNSAHTRPKEISIHFEKV